MKRPTAKRATSRRATSKRGNGDGAESGVVYTDVRRSLRHGLLGRLLG